MKKHICPRCGTAPRLRYAKNTGRGKAPYCRGCMAELMKPKVLLSKMAREAPANGDPVIKDFIAKAQSLAED